MKKIKRALAALAAGAAFAVSAFSFSASAEDYTQYTLTENETVSMFGATLTGQYYDSYGNYSSITFGNPVPLSSVGYMDKGGGFSSDGGASGWSESRVRDSINSMSGVVYTAHVDGFPTTNAPWNTNTGLTFYNVYIDLDVPNFQCYEYKQFIAWSTGTWDYYEEKYANSYQALTGHTTWVGHYQNNSVQPTAHACGRTTGPYTAWKSMPTYPYYSSQGAIDESRVTRFSFFNVSAGIGSQTSVFDHLEIGMQANQQSTVLSMTDGNAPTGDLWIIIGCPTITAYTPAETTAPTTGTTAPTTGTTAPRSTYVPATVPTDSPYYSIVYNQNINYFMLDDLIKDLNFNFNKLVANGELGLEWGRELMNIQTDDGRHLDIWNAEQSGQIQNVLTSYTYTTFDHLSYRGYKNTLQFFWDKFMQVDWIAQLAGLGLCLTVAYFVLFRKGAS